MKYNNIFKKLLYLCNLGDLLAAPFFLLLIIYFYNIQQRTFFEDKTRKRS